MAQLRIVRRSGRADPARSGVTDKLKAALDVLVGPHRQCSHLGVSRSVCGWHPQAGEMCDDCLRRHAGGHTRRCAACGQLVAPGGVLVPAEAAWGSCVVAGLGVCRACRAEGVF